MLPESIARKYKVVPLAIIDGALQVAMATPDDVSIIEALAVWARKRIEPVTAPADEIQRAIDRNYNSYREIEEQLSDIASPLPESETGTPDETITGAPVVRALNLIVSEAIKS